MLDPELSDDDVQAVIDAVAAEDRVAGHHAQFVWDGLTAGEGPEMVTQAGLQNWLWWLLPKRTMGETDLWSEVAAAGADLFERLGAARYAEICRSETTAGVHQAWARSANAGVTECRKAQDGSGVEPPSLDDFEWSEVFGSWENDARDAVEQALEAAIHQGTLAPGARGWRARAAEVCRATIDAELPGVGQSLRTMVHSERAGRWAAPFWVPADQHADREAMVPRVLVAPAAPDDDALVEAWTPLRWLVERCGEGLTLTASNYIPPAVVREAVERFGWWRWEKGPRSEADVFELGDLRDAAVRMRLLRRRGRSLTATKHGMQGLASPSAWWPTVVTEVGGEHEHPQSAAEELAMLMVGQGRLDGSDLVARAAGRLAAQNWQVAPEEAHRVHRSVVVRTLVRWEVLGLAGSIESRWEPGPKGPRQVQPAEWWLTPVGDTAVTAWMHRRVCGPRDHPA
ncbi:MAG: hypothetical protein U5K29_06660 [Acidimicrobiales bacterium]|nr:hypothetical protein [Acidimicrobiales bacterium]